MLINGVPLNDLFQIIFYLKPYDLFHSLSHSIHVRKREI